MAACGGAWLGTPEMDVFFHSDDLGASPKVNEDILSAWESGDLDGFSVLANGVAMEQVRQRLLGAATRPARISVHLNLSESRCMATAAHIPLLVDRGGNLRHSFGSLLLLWLKSSRWGRVELARQVELEWGAQIAAVQSLCAPREVIQVDGHVNVHMLPFLFPIAARCAASAGVPGIRISREAFYMADKLRDGFRPYFWINIIKHILLRLLSIKADRTARACGLNAPDKTVGVLYTGHMTRKRAHAGIAAAAQSGANKVEVVFHVGGAERHEADRWQHSPAIERFYLSPQRAVEREEIKGARHPLPKPATNRAS